MNYIKTYITLCGLTILLYCGFGFAASYNPATDISSGTRINSTIKNPYYRESKGSYDLYIGSGVYIFALNTGIVPIWNASGSNVRKLQSDYKFDLITNGGYFTYNGTNNSFQPAGRIVDSLKVIQSMVKEFFSPGLDPNLDVTISYHRSSNTMTASHEDLIVPSKDVYAFYAGPQMIHSGQILTGININTSHRQRKAVRTFIIIDKNNKPHLGVTIQGYTLPALAHKIQEMKVFNGQYHIINLDGGSSTSLAAGVRYRNSRARLPWFFGVK